MKAKRQCQQRLQSNFFAPARLVFEKVEEGETPDDAGATVITGVRSKIEEIGETVDEKIARLEQEIAEFRAENEKLKKAVGLDALTGLHNRGHYDRKILETASNALRHSRDFSVLMIDIDKFKSINDELGHTAGDDALILAGQILRETVQRPVDQVFRYGGDELLVLLPETDKDGAFVVAERIREAMENALIPHLREKYGEKANQLKCSVSIGISAFDPNSQPSGMSTENLGERIKNQADKAVYMAKAGGRNRSIVYSADMPNGRTETEMITSLKKSPEDKDEKVNAILETLTKIIPDDTLREAVLRAAADQVKKKREAKR